MEKIIAVVIMVVIVIGLIAVVVMPQSQQVTTMGESSKKQMDRFQMTSESGMVSGSAVRNDFGLGNANPNLVVLVDDDFADNTNAVLKLANGVADISGGDVANLISSDVTSGTSNTNGTPVTLSTSMVAATLMSKLTPDQIMPDAVYTKTEKTDANGFRFVLYVKQNFTN